MKGFICSAILSVLLSLSCILPMPTTAHAQTLRWLTWKTQNAGDSMAANIQWFADEFASRTGGKHKINVMWGGTGASIRENPDAISSGIGHIGDIVLPYYMDKFLLNNAASYFLPQPMSTIELADAMERWSAKYPQFSEEMARYNLRVIGYRPLEDYGLLCTKPVRTLEDMRGKRIRSYGSAYPALFKALGATPISTTTTEAYEALERGILDCTPTGLTYADSFKYDEVAKYYTTIPFGSSYGQFIVMNLKKYNALDEETRNILDSIGEENAQNFVDSLNILADKVRSGWKDKGVEYIPFPADGLKDVLQDEGIQKLRQAWIKRATKAGIPGNEIAKEFMF